MLVEEHYDHIRGLGERLAEGAKETREFELTKEELESLPA